MVFCAFATGVLFIQNPVSKLDRASPPGVATGDRNYSVTLFQILPLGSHVEMRKLHWSRRWRVWRYGRTHS